MFSQNDAETGGGAVKAGVGMNPSYVLEGVVYKTGSQTFWMNAPITLPLRQPAVVGPHAGRERDPELPARRRGGLGLHLLQPPRLVPGQPEARRVGEVFGSAGQAVVSPDYRAGIRWEPDVRTNIALTYAGKFDGDQGAGIEFGMVLSARHSSASAPAGEVTGRSPP